VECDLSPFELCENLACDREWVNTIMKTTNLYFMLKTLNPVNILHVFKDAVYVRA